MKSKHNNAMTITPTDCREIINGTARLIAQAITRDHPELAAKLRERKRVATTDGHPQRHTRPTD